MAFQYNQPVTVNQLVRLLSIPRQTAERAVAGLKPVGTHGRFQYYPLQAAITAVREARAPALDAQHEKARRDKEAADKLSLENAVTRREYAPVEVLEDTIGSVVAGWKGILRRRRDIPDEVKVALMEELARVLEREAEGAEK